MLCAYIITATLAVPAHAAQPEGDVVVPLYAVPISVTCRHTVSESSELYIRCDYLVDGTAGVTRVDITVYVEKRNLLVLWDRVDIDQPNDEWTTICYGVSNETTHRTQLPSSGTYRIVSIFEVYTGTTLVETITEISDNITC